MTEAAKHTPGPWEVGPVDDTVVTHLNHEGIRYEVAAIDGDYNDPDTWPVMEANARLIAAAPRLAAGVQAIIDEIVERFADKGASPDELHDYLARVPEYILRSLPTARPPVAPAPVEDAEREAGLVEALTELLRFDRDGDLTDRVNPVGESYQSSELGAALHKARAAISRTRQSTPVAPADETAGLREAIEDLAKRVEKLQLEWNDYDNGEERNAIVADMRALARKPAPTQTGEAQS